MRLLIAFCSLWLTWLAVGHADEPKIFCYYRSSAVDRVGYGRLEISEIDPSLCTHLLYEEVRITENGEVLGSDEAGYQKFNALRNGNEGLKTLVVNSGDSATYSKVVADTSLRSKYVENVVKFVLHHKFDGFDVHWQWPTIYGGSPMDVQNCVLLLKELRESFDKNNLTLCIMVAASEKYAERHYDIAQISKYTHFMYLHIDCHKKTDLITGHHGPLYPAARETSPLDRSCNIVAIVSDWLKEGAQAEKIILGTRFYGLSFILNNSAEHLPGSPVSGPAGYSIGPGYIGYDESCGLTSQEVWTSVWDEEQHVPYSYAGNRWISYEDITSLTEKGKYAKTMGLGGIGALTIDMDDDQGECGERYPLLKALNCGLREIACGAVPTPEASTTVENADGNLTRPDNDIPISSVAVPIPAVIGIGFVISIGIGTGITVYWCYQLKKKGLSQVDAYEISPKRLAATQVLGEGAFGVVKLSSLRDDQGHVIDVAVKMLREDSNENDRRSFLLEIKMMKELGKHPNIVSLLGCCTIGSDPFLVLEYCSRGNLHSFLRKSLTEATVAVDETNIRTTFGQGIPKREGIYKGNFKVSPTSAGSSGDYIELHSLGENQGISCSAEPVTMLDMLNFGRQIATGMEFLSSNRVVHRDLATRNILVCDDQTVKISDFGLSRDVYEENIYKKRGLGRMPLKWMAIESLTHQVYSTYSDVWSFGVLLWEIVTLGGDPYPGIPDTQILKQLQAGYRMRKPENCSMPLYNVMRSCWLTRPKDRPTFTILRQELDKLICTIAEDAYIVFNDVLEGSPLEDPEVSSSHRISPQLQLKFVNHVEPRIILGDQAEPSDEAGKDSDRESCDENSGSMRGLQSQRL